MVAAPVRWSETQYITEYLIGAPPQRAEAIVDTGSDLIWTQCAACRTGCFGQYLPVTSGGARGVQGPPTTLAFMEAPPTNFVEEEEGRRKF